MIIAISTDGDNVSPHFGRCPEFTLVKIENNKIIEKNVISNPGHHPGFLPQFLSEKGVECIIAGGMGRQAVELFNSYNIDQVTGITGRIDDVVQSFINGTLISLGTGCMAGSGKGYGIDKTVCDHANHEH